MTQVAKSAWLVQRVMLAILLMVGFYVLVFAVVGVLLWLPYAEYTLLERVDLRLALGSVALAFGLLVSLVPRRDRFAPPGPLLDEATEPRLFALVREIADATHQSMPREVYLLREANAFVGQRGGVMGIGSRRVMGIGLPLLQALPLPEVRSVVAHEFGHYTSSDVALSPWIHSTRSAIARTVDAMGDSVVSRPFVWYSRLFMRLTAIVSRRQEFIADQVSARVAGADVAARALQRVSEVAPAYALYSQTEVLPVLRAGFIPPIHEGFQHFLKSDAFRRLVTTLRDSSGDGPDAEASDTHPPLTERLRALGATAVTAMPPTIAPAASLLSNPDAYARMLLSDAFGPTAVDALRPIRWEEVANSIYAAQWRAFVAAHASWLAGLTVETLPRGRSAFLAFAKPMKIPGELENSTRIRFASTLIASALATRLIDAGWAPEQMPGLPVIVRSGVRTFDAFGTVARLADESMSEQEWAVQCRQLGLSGPLLPATLAATTPAPLPAATQAVNQEEPATRRRRRAW